MKIENSTYSILVICKIQPDQTLISFLCYLSDFAGLKLSQTQVGVTDMESSTLQLTVIAIAHRRRPTTPTQRPPRHTLLVLSRVSLASN